MKVVYSKEDVDSIRPYKNYDLTVYPKRYPALVCFNEYDGGLMGDYYTMDIMEIPENIKCPESFIKGVLNRKSNIKTYNESIFVKRNNET